MQEIPEILSQVRKNLDLMVPVEFRIQQLRALG